MKNLWKKLLTVFLAIIALLNICGCKAQPELIFTDAKIKLEANNYMVTITKESNQYVSEIHPPFAIDFSYAMYKVLVAKHDSGDKLLIIDFNTAKDAQKFLSQYGWTTNEATLTECEVTIPKEFDKIFAAYNEIQRRQGLDLSSFKKKKVTRFTYAVTNYPDYDGEVYVNILVYRNKVIGGDVCSAEPSGFIHGFERNVDK